MPTIPSNSPYPAEPRCRYAAATTGSSAHTALAAGINRIARYNNRRTISACRTYRPPARSASTSPSRGPTSARTGARQLATTMAIPTNDTALRAKTQPAPTAATTKPPTAGPTARATFMFSPFNAAACGRSLTIDQVGLYRLPRRAGHRVTTTQGKSEPQHQCRRSGTYEGRDGQRRSGQEHRRLSAQQQPSPIHQIRPGTGRQGQQHDRQTRRGLHQRHQQWGLVNQQPLRTHGLHPGAHIGGELRDPKRPENRKITQRRPRRRRPWGRS